jgi:hypothetical protein
LLHKACGESAVTNGIKEPALESLFAALEFFVRKNPIEGSPQKWATMATTGKLITSEVREAPPRKWAHVMDRPDNRNMLRYSVKKGGEIQPLVYPVQMDDIGSRIIQRWWSGFMEPESSIV